MGYDWRETLVHFARISSVLAGFCVTFVALILGGRIADYEIYTSESWSSGVTFGQSAILLFGIAAGLFICSAELFLLAKEYDVFSIPEPYRKLLKEDCKQKDIDWSEFEEEQTDRCKRNEQLGRIFYNSAIFVLFGGLFLAIVPYNALIAIVVSSLGIVLEVWQILR